jgi:hypothetical protein
MFSPKTIRRSVAATVRSLLIPLAFVSPVFSQDARDAARAKDAGQALALYLDGVIYFAKCSILRNWRRCRRRK